MERAESRRRLEQFALAHLRRRGIPVTRSYWEVIEEKLIRPAAETLTQARATDEQIEGTEAKLRLILDEIAKESRKQYRSRSYQDFPDELLREVWTNSVGLALMRLCPIWPFCK